MILYKYTDLNNFLEDTINNKQLFFNNPQNFNDPFDCNFKLDANASAQEKTDYITKNMNAQGFSQQEIDDVVNKAINNHPSWDHLVNNAKETYLSSIGVCCFSKTYENPLLWAHYSNKHKGVCLAFDTEKDKTFFDQFHAIKYRFNYPNINFISERHRFDELVLTKSNDWIYEQEVRLMKDSGGLFDFKPESLVGITFGCNTKSSDITKIKSLLTANGFNINTQKAMLREASFGLNFENI